MSGNLTSQWRLTMLQCLLDKCKHFWNLFFCSHFNILPVTPTVFTTLGWRMCCACWLCLLFLRKNLCLGEGYTHQCNWLLLLLLLFGQSKSFIVISIIIAIVQLILLLYILVYYCCIVVVLLITMINVNYNNFII